MWNNKLCLGTFDGWDISIKEQIKMFKNAGFDGFFVVWNPNINISEIRQSADELGMFFQSIHAPWNRCADMWNDGIKADEAVNELISCLKDCAENGVPIMVCHCYIGFEYSEPTQTGILNFLRVVEESERLNVKIAFENCEQQRFLDCLMETFKEKDNVGFCWDTGHEMCYNHSNDMLASYGNKLISLHLNDNLGIKANNGEVTWIDDLHLLPFDGIADWDNIAIRLNKYNYNDVLTFELIDKSKPGRHENDIYKNMGREVFLAEAFKRACRVAAIIEKYRTIFMLGDIK